MASFPDGKIPEPDLLANATLQPEKKEQQPPDPPVTRERWLTELNAALDLSNACIRNLDGTIIFWCSGNERLYGWSREEAVGKVTHQLLQTRFPKPLHEIEAELLERGSWEGELAHCTKAGAEVWVASSWVLHLTSDGTPPSVIEVNNNITDGKRADEIARHLALIVQSSDDAILSKDLNGFIKSWNAAAQALFGYSAEEVIGRSILLLFPDELIHEEADIQTRLRRGERIEHYETVRVDKSGRRIAVSLAVSPIYNAAGEVIGASKIVRDISHRKAMEEAILLSEERQRLAVEAGELGLWSYDLTSGQTWCDPRAKAMCGLPGDAPPPDYKEALCFVHPDDTELVTRTFVSSIAAGVPLDLDCRIRDAKGSLRWLHVKGRSSHPSNDVSMQIYGTLLDFTARKQTEEALQRTNSQLQEFAYAAAHDLQEPLRNVALSVGVAKAHLSGNLDLESEQLLNAAVQNAQKMHAMVRALLSYTTVLELAQDTWPVIDANAVVALALQSLSREIRQASAHITQAELPSVKMDPNHLLQVFQHLIGNAINFRASEPPQIHIGSERNMNCWTISVKDNGIGINPVFHQRVFGVFKRLRDKETEGIGIGLALCKRIVERYGCEIWIDSDGTNGTTFFFTVPTAEA